MELLALGDTTVLHVKAAAEATRDLPPELVAQVEDRLLDRAGQVTVGEFRAAARRLAARVDPRGDEEAHADRYAQRRVELYPDEHGMASIWAYLSAERATALMAALTAHAATLDDAPGAERGIDQKRADILADLADAIRPAHTDDTGGPVADAASPSPGGERRRAGGHGPAVQVTVALSTLLGYDDDPAELAGHGPIPAALAREIAADPTGTWQRLITDSAGHVLDASRAYSPPPRLRTHVTARDRTCRFPGCRRAATGCELDHIAPYATGGPTTADNLHALCPRHHHLKHEAGWHVHRRADGTTEWATPTGRHIDKPPDDPLAA
jgi:hypothetical protein